MNARSHFIVALTLISGGAVAGLMLSDRGDENSLDHPSQQLSPRADRVGRSVSSVAKPVLDQRDLASLIERKKEKAEVINPARSAMERLSAGSLKKLAVEQCAALVAMENAGKDAQVAQYVLHASIKQLWKREGLLALDWASKLSGNIDRDVLTDRLLQNALEDDPAAVFPWMEEHRPQIRRAFSSSEFVSAAMKGSIEKGVDQIVKAFEMFPGSILSNPLHSATYPSDFDFAGLYQALGKKTDLSEMVTEWTMRDGDAAWETVKGQLDGNINFFRSGSHFNNMMTARIARDGEREGIQWMLEKASTLSPELKAKQLIMTADLSEVSSEGISTIVSNLEPGERIDYASEYLSRNGVSERTSTILEMLSREDVLILMQQKNRGSNRDKVRAHLLERYQFTDEELGRIQEKNDFSDPFFE